MCGIAGAIASDGAPLIAPVLAALRHRGPDGESTWSDDRCALGQQRLAILDLTTAGQAPLSNEDGTIWMTYNGEIYNFQALRRELERSGHVFRSTGDTEVIVHAYEQWGTRCVERFRGMFALAIWDQPAGRLFLARDRVGKKPLFYFSDGMRLFFASELQGLLALPSVPREPDHEALQAYLSWGYIPAPLTGFAGIKKVPPAHTLVVDLTPAGIHEESTCYWKLSYEKKIAVSETEAVGRVRDILTEAVSLRMISDVPLGSFLSGGIDSSIIVGLMAQTSMAPVNTFSIGFENTRYDELRHARRIAQRWGTNHHEEIVRPDAAAILPLLARHYGEPFADSSAIPTYYVAKMTSKHVTVALNGDGGDESFGGYDRYRAAKWASWLNKIPGTSTAAELAQRLAPPDPKHALDRAARLLNGVRMEPAERYSHWMRYFTAPGKRVLCTPDFLASETALATTRWFEELSSGAGGSDPAEIAMSIDIASYLPYDLLVKVDIASMASSLEARSPFLDHEVMELAAQLPVRMKLKGRTGKVLLRKAFTDMLPDENARRRKMGFGVPVGDWMRGSLREMVHDLLLCPTALGRGYFNGSEIQKLVREHQDGERDHGAKLWNLLMLETWHRELVDLPTATRP